MIPKRKTLIIDLAAIMQRKIHRQQYDNGIPTSLFFNRTGLLKAAAECKNRDEMLTLYYENKKRIDADEELTTMFAPVIYPSIAQ